MKTFRWTPLFALTTLTFLAGACNDKDADETFDTGATIDTGEMVTPGETVTDGDPLVAIISPNFGEDFDVSSVQLEIEVQNFSIIDDVGGVAEDGAGHYHVYIDGVYRDYDTNPDFAWATRLSEGEHDIEVRLANNDHTELAGSGTSDTIEVVINSGAQYIEVNSPAYGQVIDSATVPVSVMVDNFTLDPNSIGDNNQSGRGHYHLYIDGDYVSAEGEEDVYAYHVSGGDHVLEARLAWNDHTETGAVDYTRFSVTADRPDITIGSPIDNDVISASMFTLQIDAENFDIVDNAGGNSAGGEGHYHIYIDDAYYDYATTTTVLIDASVFGAGEHVARVTLVNNDHTDLDPVVEDEVTFTLNF